MTILSIIRFSVLIIANGKIPSPFFEYVPFQLILYLSPLLHFFCSFGKLTLRKAQAYKIRAAGVMFTVRVFTHNCQNRPSTIVKQTRTHTNSSLHIAGPIFAHSASINILSKQCLSVRFNSNRRGGGLPSIHKPSFILFNS